MFQLNEQHLDKMSQFAQQHCPSLFVHRPENAHKGSVGVLGIIGGASGMVGAPLLAGAAALLAGCGKIFIGFHQETLPLQVYDKQPELMLQRAAQLIDNASIGTWLIGCGLGRDASAFMLLQHIMQHARSPFVVDADALRLLADQSLSSIQTFIITPHAAEAAHLLHTDSEWIQNHRQEAVLALAQRYHCLAVLKGQHTLIANENRILMTNPSGNAGLASAGTGDTLAGIMASFLAQGMPIQEAAIAAVWLHGLAADFIAEQLGGNIGIYASQLPEVARYLRNQLLEKRVFFQVA